MLVKAKGLGYYAKSRKREGDVFEIQGENEFSKRWMIKVEAPKPGKVSEVKAESELNSELKVKKKKSSGARKSVI